MDTLLPLFLQIYFSIFLSHLLILIFLFPFSLFVCLSFSPSCLSFFYFYLNSSLYFSFFLIALLEYISFLCLTPSQSPIFNVLEGLELTVEADALDNLRGPEVVKPFLEVRVEPVARVMPEFPASKNNNVSFKQVRNQSWQSSWHSAYL